MNITPKWQDQEIVLLKKLYAEGKTYNHICSVINETFWQGKKVRTFDGVKDKLKRLGWSRNGVNELPETSPSAPEDVDIKNINVILQRENEMLKRQLQDEHCKNRLIRDAIYSAVQPLPEVRAPSCDRSPKHHKPEVAILEFGDVHVGEKVIGKDVSNFDVYNFDVFCQRMDVLWASLYECAKIQKSQIPIDTLEILMNGDIITGEDIFIGQSRSIDRPLIEQTIDAAEVICQKLLRPAAQLFKKVRIRATWGNHGRVGRPGQFHQRTNFDYLTYIFMEKRMSAQKNIEFFIADCPLMLFEIPEAPRFRHLLSHGNEVRSWMSIPFYGIQRDHFRYVQLFGETIHYWHCGHFHSGAKIDIPYGEQIINGTFVGADEFSVYQLKTRTRPKQLFYGFNNNHGITWRYDLYLAHMPEMKADSNGIYTSYNGHRNHKNEEK